MKPYLLHKVFAALLLLVQATSAAFAQFYNTGTIYQDTAGAIYITKDLTNASGTFNNQGAMYIVGNMSSTGMQAAYIQGSRSHTQIKQNVAVSAGSITNNGEFYVDTVLNISSGAAVTNNGQMSINYGNVTNAGTLINNRNLFFKKDFVNASAGTFTNNINGIAVLNGNLTSNGTTGYDSGFFRFDGSSGNTATTVSGSAPFKSSYIGIANAAGVSLSNTISIGTQLQFYRGMVTAPSITAAVEFGPSGKDTLTADTMHVNGWVRKLGTGSFTYPVGDAVKYQPETISLTSNASGMNVRYYAADGGTGGYATGSPALMFHNAREYWENSPVSSAAGTVTVFYDSYNNTGISATSYASDLRVAHYINGKWQNEGPNLAGSNVNSGSTATAGSVTSGNISTWSPFTLGSISATSPLPVTIESFIASATDGCAVSVSWKAGVESGVSRYAIQSSTDGRQFITAGEVPPKGSGSSYSWSGVAIGEGTNYYRLEVRFADGTSDYSAIVSVQPDCGGTKRRIVAYPNPAGNMVHISGVQPGDHIEVFNALGQLAVQQQATDSDAEMSMVGVPPGMYHMVISTGSQVTGQITLVKE
ncbi:T9SS type A sorting domain-containing protein [Chitinophagaceae bacterium MMS25-I14]